MNLIGNALKFTPAGHVTVWVGGEQRSRGQATVRFVVEDTGIGIAADKLDRVFDKFTQADASTTRVYGGTGLGLTICRDLTHLMGGSIGVESEPARGSRFWFTLPLGLEATGRPSGRFITSAPGGESISRFSARVLVVDDNSVNLRVTENMLHRLGCRTDLATSGREALAMTAASRYDLVFMDCQMPDMDGIEAASAIRQREKIQGTPRLPIVALTAHALRRDRDRCIAAGMDDYLAKPIQRSDLVAALTRWVPGAESREDAGATPSDLPSLEGLDDLIGDGAVLAEVIQLFLTHGEQQLAEIQEAVRKGDAEGAGRAAEALGASASSIGAERLTYFCSAIKASPTDLPAKSAKVAEEFRRAVEACRQMATLD
jgi:CheY-like chemotaxis protein/HPt (histidine-containing phosphotransfer) domain-containing protein